MNVHQYGRHYSGYIHPQPDDWEHRMTRKTMFWLTIIILCIIWLLTHEACSHPLGNGLAAITGFILAPLRLVTMLDDYSTDDETDI